MEAWLMCRAMEGLRYVEAEMTTNIMFSSISVVPFIMIIPGNQEHNIGNSPKP